MPNVEELPTIQSRADYKHFLAEDLAAHNLTRWGLLYSFRKPEVYHQRLMRRVEFLNSKTGIWSKVLRTYAKFRLQRHAVRTGISFPPGVAGPGLSIAHFGSIVVNSKAKIGCYCRIHSATNIGTSGGGVPTIGDYVYIGPGAIIYGDIRVGHRAVIGANAVVNRDVPAGVTVAGAPARVISQRDSASVVPNWFPNSSYVGGSVRSARHIEPASSEATK